jgi:hypothetical protein
MYGIILTTLLLSQMPATEYDACLQTLQQSSISPAAVTTDNIKCFEHQATIDSRYALMMARYHLENGNEMTAIKFYETIVKLQDSSEGIFEYFIHLTDGPGCNELDKCLAHTKLLEIASNINDDQSAQAPDALIQIYEKAGMKNKVEEWRENAKKKCSRGVMLYSMENASSVEEKFFWRFIDNIQSKNKTDLYAEIQQLPSFDWKKFVSFSAEFTCRARPYY